MANIKISELNSLTDKAYDDLIPIVDSSANETKKISIDKLVDNNVELIAVSNDAPSECSTGDKYYNKTTNKIYTATGTNTWGTTGEDAIEGILYIVFEEQTTYAYDGETLVSVGGGAGTYVGDTPPEEPKENDLWVDTNDEEYLAQVDDTVSTTSTNAVQNQAITNYINGTVLYENTSGGTSSEITLSDSSANYSKIDVYYGFWDGGTSSYKYGITKSSIDLSVADLIMLSYTINTSASSYQREYQAWRFNTNKLTPVYQQAVYNGQDAGTGGTRISKVIGYKEA